MMSMPTSLGSLIRTSRTHGGSCPRVGGARSPHPPAARPRFDRAPLAAGPRARGSRTPRSPVPPAVRHATSSFDRHGLREVPRLVDIVSPPIGNVISEKLQWDDGEDRL